MPTPFTHLNAAQHLLNDPQIPAATRQFLEKEQGAFLLGNIAADARVSSGSLRADTHFYQYDRPIVEHPWRVMLAQHPGLRHASSDSQRAFLAGYVAHLSMDEYWSLHMLGPHFVESQWGTRESRFVMLHIILIYMDERDLAQLDPEQYTILQTAQPAEWLPFMPDPVLSQWRDFIAEQTAPEGHSETLAIFGARINKTPEQFRAILDSPHRMQTDLWNNIPQAELARIEEGMYEFAREQMQIYLQAFGGNKTG